MKNKKILMAGAAMVALSPMVAQSVLAATAPIQARARVLQAVTIAQVSQLDFGTFSVTGAANIVVAPTGAGTTQPAGINQVTGSTPTPAVAKVTAEAGFNVVLDITAPTATIQNLAADTMVISSFNIRTDAGGANEVVNMVGTTVAVPIGATLAVGAAQPAGTYTGTFTLSAAYQ